MRSRWRLRLALVVALSLGVGTCLRSPPRDTGRGSPVGVLDLGSARTQGTPIGPFRLAGAWMLTSRDDRFGGYSAMTATAPDRLLALSDQGYALAFAKPDRGFGAAISNFIGLHDQRKPMRDVEAMVHDPQTGAIWAALEGRNAIVVRRPNQPSGNPVHPPAMAGWPGNSGAEAMARLGDGRFVVLGEAYLGVADWSGHPAVLFSGDPTLPQTRAETFRFEGPDGFRPTDAALLPDGRVLILMRSLVWPLPARFAIKLVLADPSEIRAGGVWRARELAELKAPWPIDNYEALALEPERDGLVTAWILSDANGAVTQRTLLLKVEFRMADLPRKAKGAQVAPRAPR